MRVLHVDTATELRGGQRQLAYLLAGRPGDGWAGVPDAPLAGVAGAPDVALFPGGDLRNVARIRAAARAYDLVAAHTPHAHGVALLAGRPLVVHRRVDFVPRHPWKYRPAAAVVAVSEAVARIVRGVGIERVHVVYDGVPMIAPEPPLDLAAGLPRPIWGAAGALVDHKGHAWLVDAMAHVPGTLLLAGDGPLRASLDARAAPLGGRVRFLGALPTLAGFFAALDAFVHPSVEEGLGQVVLEAMGAGCRVVATTAGGVPEIVGTAGILVPPRDAPALAAAMMQALSRPAGEGIAVAAGFSVPRMVEETGAIYERAGGRDPGTR